MNTIQQIQKWSLTHHPRWLVVVRVALGLFLFIKGISFIVNATIMEKLLHSGWLSDNAAYIAIGVSWVHLLGGFLIIIGLFTRWAALVQIPILLAAIFFLNMDRQSIGNGTELPLAITILLLCMFFLVEGSGPLSLDNFFKKHQA